MAEFQRKPLGVLDRIYGFIGGLRGVNNMELGTPIQLVHDVSREAELASIDTGDQGFFVVQNGFTHAGADSQAVDGDPYETLTGVLTGVGADPQLAAQLEVWLLGWSVVCSAAALSAYVLSGIYPIAYPGQSTGTPDVNVKLLGAYFGSVTARGDAGNVIVSGTNSASFGVQDFTFPWRFPRGARYGIRGTSSGAMTTVINLYCWGGRRGTSPPGMA